MDMNQGVEFIHKGQQDVVKNDELPIVLILHQLDKAMEQVMNILFGNTQIKLFETTLEENSQINFIFTDSFDFDDINEIEIQIEQYRKLFKKYPNKFASLLIASQFERLDIMKRNIMDIFKYINKLEVPISFIITDFHLSEDKEQDEIQFRSKLKLFKPKYIIFIGKDTKKEDLLKELRKTLPELTQNNCYPMKIKDTIFEDE